MSTMHKQRVIALTTILVFLCASSGITLGPRQHKTVYSDTYWLLKIINSLWTIQTAYADENSDDSQDEISDLDALIKQLQGEWKTVQNDVRNAYAADQGAQQAKKGQGDGMKQMAKICYGISAAMAAAKNYAGAAAFAAMGAALNAEGDKMNKQAEDAKPPINMGQNLANTDSLKALQETLKEVKDQLGLLYNEGSALVEQGIIDSGFVNFLDSMITELTLVIPSDGTIAKDVIKDASAIKDDVLDLLAKEEGALSNGVDSQQESVNTSIQNSIRDILR